MMQSVSTRRRRTLGAVALVLLPIALADDAVAAATVASSSSMFFFGATVASSSSMGFGEAFMASIGVIFGTELGDKTFFIAAIMSTRHPRFTVWFGAVSALAAMTVLSTIVGHVAPMLLPPAVRCRSTDNTSTIAPPPISRPLSRVSFLLPVPFPCHLSLPLPSFSLPLLSFSILPIGPRS